MDKILPYPVESTSPMLERLRRPFRRANPTQAAPPAVPTDPFSLDRPLFHFTPVDPFTVRASMQAVQIWGGIGSGKTSGSGAALARAYLQTGYGGLVCCSKPEERKLWVRYAAETGRTDDLMIVEPGDPAPYRFNFMDYELNRPGRGGGQTENVVALLSRIVELVEGKTTPDGGERFWERAGQQLLRNAVEVLLIATGGASLQSILQFVLSAPESILEKDSLEWQEESYCWRVIDAANSKPKTERQRNDLYRAVEYWLKEYPKMDERTRSGIVSTFTGMADLLTHGLAWELLSSGTNIVPDVAWKSGSIIILDVPVQEFHTVGRIVQGIWKYMYQRAIIGRNVQEFPRPCFLWCDEAQNFISSYDFEYQAVARSARSATVFLSQNINNYYSVLGGNAKANADALLGNFQTQIFHANADHLTNTYAADKIAQAWQTVSSYGTSRGEQGPTVTAGGSDQLKYRVQPGEFINLRTGARENNLQVDAIVFKSGTPWKETGENHLKVTFSQQ